MKPDCQKHKKEVAGISDMGNLARMIADLHYETLSQLFYQLHYEFMRDSVNDKNGGRAKLSGQLEKLSTDMSNAYDSAASCWRISKPFMTEPSPDENRRHRRT